jgi:hypothetical protein
LGDDVELMRQREIARAVRRRRVASKLP